MFYLYTHPSSITTTLPVPSHIPQTATRVLKHYTRRSIAFCTGHNVLPFSSALSCKLVQAALFPTLRDKK